MGKADIFELYYWLASVSVGHPAGALAIICLWVLLTWLTYAYEMLSQDDIAPGEFLLLQCACQFFGLGTATHVCPWSITDRYIIKRHVSHAWCWFQTIKALIEAEVLWWFCSNLQGHSSSVDHCQTFSIFIIRLAKKPVLKATMLYWHLLCMYCFIHGSKKSRHQTIGKNPLSEKNAYPLVMYTSAL